MKPNGDEVLNEDSSNEKMRGAGGGRKSTPHMMCARWAVPGGQHGHAWPCPGSESSRRSCSERAQGQPVLSGVREQDWSRCTEGL